MQDGFQEFPKWITTNAGVRKIVQDAAEEAAEMAIGAPQPTPVEEKPEAALNAAAEGLDRAALVAKAEELGIKIDGRWSDARLSEEIKKATK